jgi:serine/threonine protein phosphatase PrpC
MFKNVWNGNIATYIDKINIFKTAGVVHGCFGGSSESDACHNEDGYWTIVEKDNFVISVIFDAHATNESVIYITNALKKKQEALLDAAKLGLKESFKVVSHIIHDMLFDVDFLDTAKNVIGETAFLICYQRAEFLWWLSVGDNALYVFHDEFNELGQYQVNQRIFYQWIGQKNALSLDVPCYSQGTLQLREGKSTIVMLTDGILEIEGRPYEDCRLLKTVFEENELEEATRIVLEKVQNLKGRDNATIISWRVNSTHEVLRPTRLEK